MSAEPVLDGAAALDRMLCFGLYSASRSMTRRYTALLAPSGLTYPQYLVLLLLWSQPSATVGEIAERLELDSGTTSPLLRRLERRGLLVRERRSSDERVVTVRLTEQGAALRHDLAHVPTATAEAPGLDARTYAATLETVHRVTQNLRTPEGAA